jgi:signal transduction histidine kinase
MVEYIGSSKFKDITDHNCSAKTLIKAKDEAEAEAESSNKAESQLLKNRSHEIRTYMTRIIGLTDLTLMTELTEEQRDYLTIVKSSTGLLLSVLNDILDYSKIQAAKFDLEQVPFDLREIISEVVDLFNVAAKRKDIYLRLNSIDNKIPKNLIGDSKKLKQVLSNLVGNGIRFTDNGEVALKVDIEELEKKDSRIQLKFMVSDTGIGIPEDRLVKLFKRFSQVDDSNTKGFGGAGLTISKKLVELMNGYIYVESKTGVGSTFSFTAEFGV